MSGKESRTFLPGVQQVSIISPASTCLARKGYTSLQEVVSISASTCSIWKEQEIAYLILWKSLSSYAHLPCLERNVHLVLFERHFVCICYVSGKRGVICCIRVSSGKRFVSTCIYVYAKRFASCLEFSSSALRHFRLFACDLHLWTSLICTFRM